MVEYSNYWASSQKKKKLYASQNESESNFSKQGEATVRKMLIWKEQIPAIIDNTTSLFKPIAIVGIGLLYLFGLTFLTQNLTLAILGLILYHLSFIYIFRDQFFRFQRLVRYEIPNPFPDYQFWLLNSDKGILYVTHTKEHFTTGLKLFQITIFPENVKANLERFVSTLASTYIPFSYQVVQKRLRSSLSSRNSKNNEPRFQTLVYFAVFYDIKGKLTPPKMDILNKRLMQYSVALENNFLANFHHYHIKPLKGKELASAFSTFILSPPPLPQVDQETIKSKTVKVSTTEENMKEEHNGHIGKISFTSIFKLIWVLGVMFSLDLVWIGLMIPLGYRILSFAGIGIMLYLQWIPSLRSLYQKNPIELTFSDEAYEIDLFAGVSFFKLPRMSDTLFYQTQDGIVGGIKLLHIHYASVPIIPLAYIGHHMPPTTKVYEALIQQHIPFTYTLQALPTSYSGLIQFSRYLEKPTWDWMRHTLKTPFLQTNWLAQRRGIWRTMMTFSTSYSLYDTSGNPITLDQIELRLQHNLASLKNAFRAHFPNCHISLLKARSLEMGILFELLKNNRIRSEGTHLYHLLMQGFNLPAFLWLSDLFKKGIETKVATEFNSPLLLENFITIGWTINTETLNKEIPAGFTKVQLDNLLITNGRVKQHIYLMMHIVGELVKKGYPTIIFDFTGDWTRLFRKFEGTEWEVNFLYYKLGKTFNLDLVHSGIQHDLKNMDYLEYMFDAYANCFKKDDRTLDIFKNTFQRNLGRQNELSSSTIASDLLSKPEWMKKQEPGMISVINFFKDFTRQELNIFHTNSSTLTSQSLIEQLLTNEHTILIDLSSVTTLEKKVFLMFVVLAKLIHYIRNGYEFSPKFITLPHIDMVFDAFFIDKNMHYGRICKFFDPLRSNGFGFLASASQARYLHSTLFNYFENIVAFKVVDKRDIGVLKNIMGLDSLHGTGFYSKSRNETYQIQYLMNMRDTEAIVKRDDNYQPFPIEVNWNELSQALPYTWEEVVVYMKQKGVDLEYAVKQLIAETKETLFEKDFGEYFFLIEPLHSFLSDLRTMDQIGNLFSETIKNELKIRLDSKLSQFSKDKKRKKVIRNKIFDLLVKHGYLKEHHPPQASGSESMRTSYYVGPKFDKALKDFIDVKKQIPTEVEIIQQESDVPFESYEHTLGELQKETNSEPETHSDQQLSPTLDTHRIKKVIAQVNSSMFMELFEIDRAINRKDFRSGLEIAKQYFENFIFSVYNGYYKVDYVIANQDLDNFIADLTRLPEFPYTVEQFDSLVSQTEEISFQEENLEQTLREICGKLQKFHTTLRTFVYLPHISQDQGYQGDSKNYSHNFRKQILNIIEKLEIPNWLKLLYDEIKSFDPLEVEDFQFFMYFWGELEQYYEQQNGLIKDSSHRMIRVIEGLGVPAILRQNLRSLNHLRNMQVHTTQSRVLNPEVKRMSKQNKTKLYNTFFMFLSFLVDTHLEYKLDYIKQLEHILTLRFSEPFEQSNFLCQLIKSSVDSYFSFKISSKVKLKSGGIKTDD